MPDVIYKSVAGNSQVRDFFFDQFGVSPRTAEGRLLLTDRQARQAFQRDPLYFHPRIALDPDRRHEQAELLYRQVPGDLKSYQRSPPSQLHLSVGYGIISQVEEAQSRLAIAPDFEARDIIAKFVIPTMQECYKVDHVCGVSANASFQQACISLSKVAFLAETHANADHVWDLIQKRRVLHGALPNAPDILTFVEALTKYLSIRLYTSHPMPRVLLAFSHVRDVQVQE